MPHRLVPRPLLRRLGRRGSVLVLLGLAWAVQGLYLASSDAVPASNVSLLHHIPHIILGLLWLTFGCTSAAIGCLNQRHDHLGFLAASAMPLLYTASYFVSAITWVVTLGAAGWAWGIAGAGIWSCVVVLIGILAAWPEPPFAAPDYTDRGW